MNPIVAYLFFPGFVFAAALGMFVNWFDRKVTARVQWRVGPPLLQPLYDITKLLGKETVIPRGCSRGAFLLSPLFGLAAITLVATLIGMALLFPDRGFVGDLIVVLYFMMVPSVAVIVGAFASKNPIASLGASREMKLMLADELPFLLAVAVPIIQAGGTIRLGQLVGYQSTYGWILGSFSGVIALVVALLSVQAKLTLVPFDLPEAETEIMGGAYVEYSGPPLAMFKLTRMMCHATFPMLLVLLFLGGLDIHGWGILWSVLKYGVLLLLITLIRNTNPRLRIDQAVRFFWGPMTVLGIGAVILAFLGL